MVLGPRRLERRRPSALLWQPLFIEAGVRGRSPREKKFGLLALGDQKGRGGGGLIHGTGNMVLGPRRLERRMPSAVLWPLLFRETGVRGRSTREEKNWVPHRDGFRTVTGSAPGRVPHRDGVRTGTGSAPGRVPHRDGFRTGTGSAPGRVPQLSLGD